MKISKYMRSKDAKRLVIFVKKVKKRFTVFMNKHPFLRNMLQVYLMAIVGFFAVAFGVWIVVGLYPNIGVWALLLALAYAGLLISGKCIIEKLKYNQQILPLYIAAEVAERGIRKAAAEFQSMKRVRR